MCVIAVAFVALIKAGEHPSAAFAIGGLALPAMFFFLSEKNGVRADRMGRLVASLVVLTGWSYVVWNYVWFPPFAVLTATITWRFLVHAGDLNAIEDDGARFRRIAGFGALAFLGLGLLLLDHGGPNGTLASTNFANITDRIAASVLAPIWLVHIMLTSKDEKPASHHSLRAPAS
jgi:hypothetical protein